MNAFTQQVIRIVTKELELGLATRGLYSRCVGAMLTRNIGKGPLK